MTDGQGRTSLSLTTETDEVVTNLCERYPFPERVDAARFGLAFALRRSIAVPTDHRAGGTGAGTTWGIGTFDQDGHIRELVRAMNPDEAGDPYVMVEGLMNTGLMQVRDRLAENPPSSLSELMELADAETP